MKNTLLICAMLSNGVLISVQAQAQENVETAPSTEQAVGQTPGRPTPPGPDPASEPEIKEASSDKEEGTDKKEESKIKPPSLSYEASYTHLYNNNVFRDEEDPVRVRANILGLGARYIRPAKDSSLEIAYDIGRHFYPEEAEERDRISHNLNASWEKELSDRWNFELAGNVSIKGSAEDDDISNQYVISPRFEYKLSSQNRVRFYGAYRLRRFPDDSVRNSTNPYVGLEFQHRMNGNRQIEFGYRYEVNRAKSERYDYKRQTLSAEYSTPVGKRNELELEVKLRPRRYDSREADNGELRRDRNLILGASWTHHLRKDWDIIADYQWERRRSNDPDAKFSQQVAAVSALYKF